MREQLHIGEVAKLIGVSPKTIRYYHEVGLLAEPPRTGSGYRLYTGQDLLRLQRIRHLRSLGLSLERIKEILGQPDQRHEQTLRNALQSLVEELSAQILELEERRDMLKKLLTEDVLEQSPTSTPEAYLFKVREHLGSYLSNTDSASFQWAEKLDAMLGTFQWPADYREMIQSVVQHIAAQPEQYQQILALEERFNNLVNEPEDSPEVEKLAEDYAQCSELALLQQNLSAYQSFEQSPFFHAMSDLMAAQISPAQHRFYEVLSHKLSSSPAKNGEVTKASKAEQG